MSLIWPSSIVRHACSSDRSNYIEVDRECIKEDVFDGALPCFEGNYLEVGNGTSLQISPIRLR